MCKQKILFTLGFFGFLCSIGLIIYQIINTTHVYNPTYDIPLVVKIGQILHDITTLMPLLLSLNILITSQYNTKNKFLNFYIYFVSNIIIIIYLLFIIILLLILYILFFLLNINLYLYNFDYNILLNNFMFYLIMHLLLKMLALKHYHILM